MTRLKKDYPWLSYSDCRTFYSCKRKFKFAILDGVQATQSFDWLVRGSEFHHMFNIFFDTVDVKKTVELASKIKILDEPTDTELFKYFHELMVSFINKDLVEQDRYAHLFDLNAYGFAAFQVMVITEIMRVNGYINMTMLRKYWLPLGREEFMKDEENMLYGTVDSFYEHFDGTFFALDYKTGKKKYRPKTKDGVLKRPRINFPANMQGWFYTWLLHKTRGYPLKGMKFVLLYTKGNPLAVTLRITKASVKGLFRRVEFIREYVKDKNSTFPMIEPDSQIFMCPYCQFQKKCHDDETLERFAKIRKEEWAE
jgi:CRISPR/Cas system-associated exonuclease Cas4 (RecB family)